MNNITFSKDKVSLCRKNKCINVKGDIAQAITFSIAILFVVSSVASLIKASE
ncbi:hypothetical protein [Tenacibaculum soleae]|uniref:hypothetical protein n=1 Tax=Tenacibaculum soleae TaxID=447689 RepID=UPI0026E426FC|nr:hypothetical protein [Tenacibaculum soleae]MDO6813232.1 hypothetical protein [Tenacibaculum soleae]